MLDWLATMMPLLADMEMSVTRAALASLICFIMLTRLGRIGKSWPLRVMLPAVLPSAPDIRQRREGRTVEGIKNNDFKKTGDGRIFITVELEKADRVWYV